MKVCIAGGGTVGMYLAQSLLAHRHKVTIIEPQEMLCRSLAASLDIPVICGDAISFDNMRTADVASCDAFVAVTEMCIRDRASGALVSNAPTTSSRPAAER